MPPVSKKVVVRTNVYPHRVDQTVGWEEKAYADAGLEFRFVRTSTPEELREAVKDADAVVTGGGTYDVATFDAMTRCKVVVSCSVGLDRFDLAAASARAVMVCNMPDLCTDEVADHAMALLLACNRKVVALANRVRGGTWDRALLEPMPRLRGKTIGLLGFGRIGQAMAERCRGFGMNVAAYDPYLPAEVARERGVELLPLEGLLAASDFVSCHLPHNESTHHLMGEAQFRAMKPSALFVNSSRGRVVDEVALTRALREGWIAGAGLDVLEQEPPDPNNPILQLPTAVVTPHAAGFSDEVVDLIPRMAFDEVMAVLNGGTPRPIAWANRAAFQVGAASS
jgi:D-3-phosphoglycerate dehydrogenase / 2-oxoglutarate reductase